MNDDVDKLLKMNDISDQDLIVELARLCRHRGKCMDIDEKRANLYKRLSDNQEAMIKNLEGQLKMERQLPGLTRWMTALNNWAKS